MSSRAQPTPSGLARLRHALPPLFGAALLGWFCRSLDWREFWAALSRVSPRVFFALVLLTLLATVFQGLRFFVLFPNRLDWRRHTLLAFALSAGNILLPLRGGEAIRPLYMKRWVPETPLRALVLWSIVDKVIEALCLLPIALLAWILFAADPRFRFLQGWVLPAVGAVLIALTIVALRQRWRSRARLLTELGTVTATQLGLAVGLSLLVWVANYSIFYVVAPDAKLALALLLSVSLSVGVPGLPAGLGPYEAAFLWIGQHFGWSREPLLAAALVSHLVQILTSLLVTLPIFGAWGWPQRLGSEEPVASANPGLSVGLQ